MSRLAAWRSSLARRLRDPSVVLPGLIVAFVLFTQWPMLKGMAYRTLGISPRQDNIAWRTDIRAALAEAQRTGKPVLLDFSAEWCPPCQVMKYDVWPDPAVGEAVGSGYIPVYIDADAAGSEELARKYGVDTIPRIIVVDGDGRVLKEEGYMSRGAMLKFLGSKG